MFNHPTIRMEHALQTTLPHDAIKVVYLNRSNDIVSGNALALAKPAVKSVDLSEHVNVLGMVGSAHAKAKAKAREQLEAAFAAIIVSDDEDIITKTLVDVRLIMGNSSKWPLLILATPTASLMNNSLAEKIFAARTKIGTKNDQKITLNNIAAAVLPVISRLLIEAQRPMKNVSNSP